MITYKNKNTLEITSIFEIMLYSRYGKKYNNQTFIALD